MASRHTLLTAAVLVACTTACAGLDAGVDYPDTSVDLDRFMVTPENEPDPSIDFTEAKIAPQTCEGIDTQPVTQPLGPDDFTRFLEARGVKVTPKKARSNLYWYDFPDGDGGFVRLRLAVLESPEAAAKDLHDSLLLHGPGWWGLRRSNLAVLAPKASLSTALEFAVEHKLVCWGMFTMAGVDDAYVVPGPYGQL